jgi:hypothetical protein
VKVWTAHEKPHASPILLREGFSFGALIFGPFWLAAHRAWLPAGAALVLSILILVLTHPPASAVLLLGLAVLLGMSGRDLVRWSIARRGYRESGVVTGRNQDEAQVRLLGERPDLVERSMASEAAR